MFFHVISLRGVRRHWARLLAIAAALAYSPWLWGMAAHSAIGAASPRGVISRLPTQARWVALAFDDGPNPAAAGAILADLDRYQAHASFFVVGLNAERERRFIIAAARAGNAIENHTDGHINLSIHTFAQDLADLKAANQAIRSISGATPHWLSPPYGAISRAAQRAAGKLNLAIVLPTPGERVANGAPSPSAIIRQIMAHVEPGSIIMLPDGPGNEAALKALPTILSLLRVEGYRVGSISQVWRETHQNIGRNSTNWR